MTLDAFLTWERVQELRYEFDGVRPVAMNGGTLDHSRIAFRAAPAVEGRFTNSGCSVFNKDAKILVAERIRYPDVVVTCSPVVGTSDIVPDPVVVIEVLSPSTAAVDRIEKNAEYRATASIQHHVMLEHARRAATVFSRNGDDWAGHIVVGECCVKLPAIGVELPLGPFYEGLTLVDEDP